MFVTQSCLTICDPIGCTLAWRIPWMEEPGGLQSMGSWRIGQDWATSLSLFTFMHWRRNGNPLQCSCLENPRDGGAWWMPSMGSHRVRHDWSDLAAAADCSLPGSSVHGILQARILEWVAIPFSKDPPEQRIEPGTPSLQTDSLLPKPPGKFWVCIFYRNLNTQIKE